MVAGAQTGGARIPRRTTWRTPLRRAGRLAGSRPVSILIYVAVIAGIVLAALNGAAAMGYNWQWHRVPQFLYSFTDDGFQLGEIFHGLLATIQLSATAFALAVALGAFRPADIKQAMRRGGGPKAST